MKANIWANLTIFKLSKIQIIITKIIFKYILGRKIELQSSCDSEHDNEELKKNNENKKHFPASSGSKNRSR